MNKFKRMVFLPLMAAAAAAGVVEGIIIYNRMAKVKVADAALREMKKAEAEKEAESESEAAAEPESETIEESESETAAESESEAVAEADNAAAESEE